MHHIISLNMDVVVSLIDETHKILIGEKKREILKKIISWVQICKNTIIVEYRVLLEQIL